MSYIHEEQLKELVKDIPAGQVFRIGYRTEVPVKAMYKKCGIRIEKITEATVRTGVSYKNLASTIVTNDSINKRSSFKNWIFKNRLFQNINNNKLYLQVVGFKNGTKSKSLYIIHGINSNNEIVVLSSKDFKNSNFVEMIQNSYFNKTSDCELKTINIDNIYKIGSFVVSQDIFSII